MMNNIDQPTRYLHDSDNLRGPGSAYFRLYSLRPGYLSGQNGDYPNDWHCRVLTKAPIFGPITDRGRTSSVKSRQRQFRTGNDRHIAYPSPRNAPLHSKRCRNSCVTLF